MRNVGITNNFSKITTNQTTFHMMEIKTIMDLDSFTSFADFMTKLVEDHK